MEELEKLRIIEDKYKTTLTALKNLVEEFKNKDDLKNALIRINTLIEFMEYFG